MDSTDGYLDRRDVIKAAGAAGTAGLVGLAGCSGGGGGGGGGGLDHVTSIQIAISAIHAQTGG